MKNTKERIFESAVELFARRGYHGTSIRDIAGESGIKESSLYNHYKGKEAILQAALDYQMNAFRESAGALEALKGKMPETADAVDFWMIGARTFLSKQGPLNEKISRIIVNEMYLNQKCRTFVLESLFAARKELTETIFRVMHVKGLIRSGDFGMLAEQYVAMLQGLEIEHTLRSLEGFDPEYGMKRMMEQITLFIEGMKE